MVFKLGSASISGVKLGSTGISKAYLGTTVVLQGAGSMLPPDSTQKDTDKNDNNSKEK
jgi:predicted phage tail protein|tara:strand:- start:1462 stop:1635 length:174 start_codon:yes stop_codon:yes gene_type:complete